MKRGETLPVNWLLRRNSVGWLALVVLLLGAAPGESRAQVTADLYAGPMWSYYSGDVGYSLVAAMMAGTEESGWSYGGEFEYRSLSMNMGDVLGLNDPVQDDLSDTDARTLLVRAHGRYDFLRESFIRPYVNLGLGVSFNWLDDEIVVTSSDVNGQSVVHRVINTKPVGFDVLGGVGAQTEISIGERAIRVALEMRASMNVAPVSMLRVRDNKLSDEWAFLGGAGVYLGAGYQW
jgi:hypothetical protein